MEEDEEELLVEEDEEELLAEGEDDTVEDADVQEDDIDTAKNELKVAETGRYFSYSVIHHAMEPLIKIKIIFQ